MPELPSEPIWHHSGWSLSHITCLTKGHLASSSRSWVIVRHHNKSHSVLVKWQTTDHNKYQTSDQSEVQIPPSTTSRVTLCQLWQQRVGLWAACVINAWQVWLYSKQLKCIWKCILWSEHHFLSSGLCKQVCYSAGKLHSRWCNHSSVEAVCTNL